MMTGTGGSVNNKDAEDVFTNPRGFNLLVINEWGQETGIFYSSFLKVMGEPGNLVPNIELAMMQLIHSRKALETDPITCRNYRNSQLLWKRCLPSKDPTYSTKIKLLSSPS
jgi:hypothetical protein